MTTLDHQLIALTAVRANLSDVRRILLAVIAAALWGLGYGVAATLRGIARAALWAAAAVSEGWADVWSDGSP